MQVVEKIEKVQVVPETLFDEVWCSCLDEKKVRSQFISSPVKPKIFVPCGKAYLVKHEGNFSQPGFVGVDKNLIVGTMELE